MTDQPGPRDPAERRPADRPGKGVDVFGDLQRWFIRQSAKNMRNQISGQVRRTLGGGRETSDVWDTATNEIPPEVGESPECQWCPICRAARRMRDSGPGIGDHLSGAGDVVASAVQDAIGALDSLLSKAGTGPTRESTGSDGTRRGAAAADGPASDNTAKDNTAKDNTAKDSTAGEGTAGEATAGEGTAGEGTAGNSTARANGHWGNASRQSPGSSTAGPSSAAGSASTDAAAGSAAGSWAAGAPARSATDSGSQERTSDQPGHDRAAPESRRDRHGLVGLPGGDSAAGGSPAGSAAYPGDSRPAGKPADRLARAQDSEPDPWGAATASAEADQDSDADILSDRPGHEPDDRG